MYVYGEKKWSKYDKISTCGKLENIEIIELYLKLFENLKGSQNKKFSQVVP